MDISNTPNKKTKFLVSLGAYDGNLFGVQLRCNMNFGAEVTGDKEDEIESDHGSKTEPSKDESKLLHRGFFSRSKFAFKAAEGSIRCIANSDKFLAIGGYEEVIKIFNIKKYLEVGELVDHKGTITCLQFFKNEYLLSAADDGEIFIWRVRDFILLYRLKNPKPSPVIDLAVHPSGKLAFAVYKSHHMILWDLTKGKNKLKRVS